MLFALSFAMGLAGTSANVHAVPNSRGYVRFSVAVDGFETAPDLRAAIEKTTGCKMTGGLPDYLSGTCRMLSSDSGLTDGWLRLAPLTAALHEAGVDTVNLRVTLADGSMQSLGGWIAAGQGYEFESKSASELPPALGIRTGRRVNMARIFVPLLLVLFVPGLVALWLERRSRAAMVWLNWILLATWLYWISAVDIGDITAYFGSLTLPPAMGAVYGALLYSVPPLAAIAGALIALTPQLLPGRHSWDDFSRLLKRGIVGSAASIVPLGIFLVGSGMYEYGWQMAAGSMVAAFLAYRALSWFAWRWSFVEMRAVDSGELLERVLRLAAKAQVKVRGVYILRNRCPRESNAFAMSGQRIAVTEGLLEHLSKREVDAVMAHELGHLKGRHAGAQALLFWAYFLIAGPLEGYLISHFGAPGWLRSLPIAPVLAALAIAFLSQRHEFSADARAAEITGDPEAKITALTRLARLTGVPLEWGGIQGSILSHPSMRARVLSIAKRAGVPRERALALLENPDLGLSESFDLRQLGRAVGEANYAVPREGLATDPVFHTAAKVAHLTKASWISEGLVVVLLFALAFGANAVSKWGLWVFLLGIPVVFEAMRRVEIFYRRGFLHGLRDKVRRSTGDFGGRYIGLMPGSEVRRAEGFGEWDLGFLHLDADSLMYHGEKARFSMPRSYINSVELEKGSFTWTHSQRVVIRWTGGAFSLQVPGAGPSRREGMKLCAELSEWWRGMRLTETRSMLPPPRLPLVHGDDLSLLRVAWIVAMKGGALAIGCAMVCTLLPFNIYNALVAVAAPLIIALDAAPAALAKRPKPMERVLALEPKERAREAQAK